MSARTASDFFILILKGIIMGAANKVPGVSGGTVAFVTGFYEEFVDSLHRFDKRALRLLFTKGPKTFFHYVNGAFLSAIFLGTIISFFTVAQALDYALQYYESYTWALFFGMIFASIFYIRKSVSIWNQASIISCILGILIGLSVTILPPFQENGHWLFVLFCGFISVCGMTLPGLSGSFLLILFGNYGLLMVDSVNALYLSIADLLRGDSTFFANSERIYLLQTLVLFSIGSIGGLIGFSHLLSYLLKHFHQKTMATIIGFIIGSLGVVWPWKKASFLLENGSIVTHKGNPLVTGYERYLPQLDIDFIYHIVAAVIGAMIVVFLEQYAGQKKSQ